MKRKKNRRKGRKAIHTCRPMAYIRRVLRERPLNLVRGLKKQTAAKFKVIPVPWLGLPIQFIINVKQKAHCRGKLTY